MHRPTVADAISITDIRESCSNLLEAQMRLTEQLAEDEDSLPRDVLISAVFRMSCLVCHHCHYVLKLGEMLHHEMDEEWFGRLTLVVESAMALDDTVEGLDNLRRHVTVLQELTRLLDELDERCRTVALTEVDPVEVTDDALADLLGDN